MRIRQIGSTVFDADTNIIVDATALEAVGSGVRVDELDGPQPFAAVIAFVRSTRQQALNALNRLVYEAHIEKKRALFNVAGGLVVWIENKNGNAVLRSYLTNISFSLISIEATTTGVIARIRLTGTLTAPFINTQLVSNTFSSLKPYGLYVLPLSNINSYTLAFHNIDVTINNGNEVSNALFAFEVLKDIYQTRRIYRKNPSFASSNLVLESFNAEPGKTIIRARFTANGNGTITYNLGPSELYPDVYNLFFEVYLPFWPSYGVKYDISWDGQPTISGFVDLKQTFIKAGIFSYADLPNTITINITDAPANTYVSPLIFIPIDNTFVYNAIASNLARFSAYHPMTQNQRSLYAGGSERGVLLGPPGFIAGDALAVFTGMMKPTITQLTATVKIYSHRIEPASFM